PRRRVRRNLPIHAFSCSLLTLAEKESLVPHNLGAGTTWRTPCIAKSTARSASGPPRSRRGCLALVAAWSRSCPAHPRKHHGPRRRTGQPRVGDVASAPVVLGPV